MATTSFDRADIEISNTGDLVVSSTGDLELASTDQVNRQNVLMALYTPYGDFRAYPSWGSTVYQFIGEPNSRANASLLRNEMARALVATNMFANQNIQIDIFPIGVAEIMADIIIQDSVAEIPTTLNFIFNYIAGLQVTA